VYIFFLALRKKAGASGKRISCVKEKTAGVLLPGEGVF
jgi:hypothetical protein